MDVVFGGLVAIAASVLTMIGTFYRDHVQARRDKKATERQELLAACKAFLRGVEIRRGHMMREWLEKSELSPDVVTEGIHEVIRGNADVQLLTTSRRVADAAHALWLSLYSGDRIDTDLVNRCRAEFIAAAHEELGMPALEAPPEAQDPTPAPGGAQASAEAAQRPWWRRVFGS